MRRQVARVAVVVVALAVVLLAVPLAVGIKLSFFDQERGELERAAFATVVHVDPSFTSG